jgi:hypothetical protein
MELKKFILKIFDNYLPKKSLYKKFENEFHINIILKLFALKSTFSQSKLKTSSYYNLLF